MKNSKFLRLINNSENVSWKISELLPDDFEIQFDKRFLPVSITGEEQFSELPEHLKLDLNHIWGASYFNLFAFVEEYITLFSLNIANDYTFKENDKLRAYVRFSEEEIKHQMLFQKYLKKFHESYKVECQFIDGEKEVASTILSNSKLCVLLLTCHLELLTQDHYLHSIRKETELDEKFKSILKNHWLEEAQHSRLDIIKLNEEYHTLNEQEVQQGIEEYFMIIEAFIGLLNLQSQYNYDSLMKCMTKEEQVKFKNEAYQQEFIQKQLKQYIHCFLVLGLENKTFNNVLESLDLNLLDKIKEKRNQLINLYYNVSIAA